MPPPHLAKAIEAACPKTPPPARPRLTALALGLAGEYYVDDVCLSQRGAHHMKQLEAEMGITHTRRKRRFKNENTEKDAGKCDSMFVFCVCTVHDCKEKVDRIIMSEPQTKELTSVVGTVNELFVGSLQTMFIHFDMIKL